MVGRAGSGQRHLIAEQDVGDRQTVGRSLEAVESRPARAAAAGADHQAALLACRRIERNEREPRRVVADHDLEAVERGARLGHLEREIDRVAPATIVSAGVSAMLTAARAAGTTASPIAPRSATRTAHAEPPGQE